MRVNDMEIDIKQAASAIAAAYAVKAEICKTAPCAGEIENMLQDYLYAYRQVISKTPEELESLLP